MANNSRRPIEENLNEIQIIVNPNKIHRLRGNLCKQLIIGNELRTLDVNIP